MNGDLLAITKMVIDLSIVSLLGPDSGLGDKYVFNTIYISSVLTYVLSTKERFQNYYELSAKVTC